MLAICTQDTHVYTRHAFTHFCNIHMPPPPTTIHHQARMDGPTHTHAYTSTHITQVDLSRHRKELLNSLHRLVRAATEATMLADSAADGQSDRYAENP